MQTEVTDTGQPTLTPKALASYSTRFSGACVNTSVVLNQFLPACTVASLLAITPPVSTVRPLTVTWKPWSPA